jgi:hypothetical protein
MIEFSIFQNIRETKKPQKITIEQWVDAIRGDRYAEKIAEIRRVYQQTGKSAANELKKSLPTAVLAGTMTERRKGGFTAYSGLIQIDIDHMDTPEQIRDMLRNDPFVVFAALSPSGTGVKAAVRYATTETDNDKNYILHAEQAIKYFLEKYGIDIDPITKQAEGGCYITHDPHCHYNPHTDAMSPTDPLEVADPTNTLNIRTFAEMLEPQPPRRWVVDGVIEAGSLSFFYGDSGAKKSWLLMDLYFNLSLGKKWLGHGTNLGDGVALWLDCEQGERTISERGTMLARAYEIPHYAPPDNILWATPSDYIDLFNSERAGEFRNYLENIITQNNIKICVIDPFLNVIGDADENKAGDMGRVTRPLLAIARATDCAIVVIHHANKSNGYRGSSAIKAAVDNMFSVMNDANNKNILTVNGEKQRNGQTATITAQATWYTDENGEWAFHMAETETVDLNPSKRLSPKQQEAADFIEKYAEMGCPHDALKTEFGEKYAKTLAHELRTAGKIKTEGIGKNTVHFSVSG